MYRGGAEQKIRKYLVDNNFVDAIIQLPSNLFLNVTISVDIMLLKKNKADNAVLFVDASKEFVKVTKNNRLSEENIQRIVSAVAERKDEQHFARLVPNDEVGSKQNNYNLSVSTYVEQEDTSLFRKDNRAIVSSRRSPAQSANTRFLLYLNITTPQQ